MDMLVVFGIIGCALLLFITEVLPLDVSAIAVMVLVMVLEPWTGVSPSDAVSGFSSAATLTVLAMFIISEGVRRTGLLQSIGNRIVAWAGGRSFRAYGALVGVSGTTAGFINNTPVVAMMIPMVMSIARRTNTSPSKLLMPVSFAAMMGGMLTLIGTSTNILASDVSARLLGHPFSMFEFTSLGALVLVAGTIYLLTLGRALLPVRVKPQDDLTEEFALSNYLAEVTVHADSPLIGKVVETTMAALHVDVDVVHLVRDGNVFPAPIGNKQFRAGDTLLLRTGREELLQLMSTQGLEPAGSSTITEEDFDVPGESLVEVVLLSENPLVGETLRSIRFAQRYDALVLAIRRRGEVLNNHLDSIPLQGGDTLLVQAASASLQRLNNNRSFVVVQQQEAPEYRTEKLPIALAILAGVVGLAAFEVVPILESALAGIVAMVVTGCVQPNEMYRSVDWSVIFLLAGLIPLGMALERSGAAAYMAHYLASSVDGLPVVLILFLFYLFTAVITEVLSNNASVVLMIPIAIESAQLVGGDPFSFVLVVTFAASTALMTPVGYQTNLMVYGPGGYRFTDFFRVGAPLQLILAVVTCGGIWALWGV